MPPSVSARENAEAKGRRYIVEGRLRILMVKGGRAFAECRGNGAVYHPCYIGNRWRCDCPARTRCAHLVALQLVVDAPRSGDGP